MSHHCFYLSYDRIYTCLDAQFEHSSQSKNDFLGGLGALSLALPSGILLGTPSRPPKGPLEQEFP